MNADPNSAKAIFLEAVERHAPGQWPAFLDRACADRADLRGRVEALLEAHREVGTARHRELAEGADPSPVATAEEPPVREQPGAVIGPYKLLEQIGEGGFGVVFMAEQTQPVRRKVALKVLKPGMDTRQVVARFEAERQALALMDHPNIAHILDGGETTSGRPYFVMELVRGIPITEFCDQNHFSVRERLELFGSVCQAVQHAHHKGVIHRDLKPSNILVTRHDDRPVVKVIDFGIAKALGRHLTDETLFTNFGQVMGTPLYMSPEQAQLSSLDIDTRSDIYSLGVVLYELLTGTTPFEQERLRKVPYDEIRRIIREEEQARPSIRISTLGPTAVTVSANRQSDPKRLSQLFRGELDWVVMKALEKDCNRRYETASAFAADVQHYLHDEPVRACPPALAYRLRKFVRRNKGPLLAVALVVLALVGGMIGTTWGMFRATVAEAEALSEAKQKEGALKDKEAAFAAVTRSERDARGQLFLALLTKAQALRKSGQMGQRFQTLKTLEQAVATARLLGVLEEHLLALRNEAVACLTLADLRVAREWEGPAGPDPIWRGSSVAFDAELGRYACPDPQGNISVREVASHQEVMRLPGPGAKVQHLNQGFSADGRFLAAAYWLADRRYQFVLWELPPARIAERGARSEDRSALEGPYRRIGPTDGVGFFAFSQDGRQLAVGQPDGSILLHDLRKGEQKSLGPNYFAGAMAFRPDGRQLALTKIGELTRVRILDLETNQIARTLDHPDDVKVLAWSPDGRLLAAGGDDRNVHVWNTEEWKPQALLEGHQRYVCAVAFSPAGDLLASSALDGTTRLWDPVSGRPLLTAPGICRHFSPDGQRLAFLREDHFGIWEVADGRECQVLHHGRVGNRTPWVSYKGPDGLDFSPDCRLLASASGDGVRLWDVPGRQEIAFLNAGYHEAVVFHPDGTRLYTFGRTGLRCWPIRPDDRGPSSLRMGPPESLSSSGEQDWFRGARSDKGHLIAGGVHLDDRRDRLLLFPPESPAERTVLGEDFKFARIAVSPDGRWVAAGLIEPQMGIQVWDARTGRLAWSLKCEQVYVLFSPDGEWLLAGGPVDYRAWKTGSWEPGPIFPRDRQGMFSGQAAFRPDGRVLAAPRSLQHVQLLDFATRREIATLPGPDQACIDDWLCFNPDGNLLAAAAESHSIHLWDLDAIGGRLRELGLGCDLLPDRGGRARAAPSSRSTGPSGGAPLRVRVFQDVYEAEHLPILDKVDCWAIVQDMKPWGREHWSNGAQLLCPTSRGGFVELQVEVAEPGRYVLEVRFTQAPNYGVVEVSLDGQKRGPVFDGYHEVVKPSGPIRFGTVELREGRHRLRFTAVDRNPKSTGDGMGIDCVKLTPEGEKATR